MRFFNDAGLYAVLCSIAAWSVTGQNHISVGYYELMYILGLYSAKLLQSLPNFSHQVCTADIGQDQIVSPAEEVLLLPERIEDHEVEEDAEQGQGHVQGDHDHTVHHPIHLKPVDSRAQD